MLSYRNLLLNAVHEQINAAKEPFVHGQINAAEESFV